MPNAFLSYSRESEGSVRQICDDLNSCGIDEVWWDDRLVGAQSWWDTILQQIRTADVVVCLIDVGMPESAAVRREYQYAIDLGKPLLPILLSDHVEISTLPIQLASTQYVDYRPGCSDPLDGLMDAVNNLPSAPALPQPLPPEPPIPISEQHFLLEKVSSTEPLNHDVQINVLSRLSRLARSDETEEREFALSSLKRLRNRPELLASVGYDIDAVIVKPVSVQNNNKGVKTVAAVMGGLFLVLVAGYFYQTGAGHRLAGDSNETTVTDNTVVSTDAANESENSTQQNDNRVVEAGVQSQPELDKPIAGGALVTVSDEISGLLPDGADVSATVDHAGPPTNDNNSSSLSSIQRSATSPQVEPVDNSGSVSSNEISTTALSDVELSSTDQGGASKKVKPESVVDVISLPNNQSSAATDGSDSPLAKVTTTADKATAEQSTTDQAVNSGGEATTDYTTVAKKTPIEEWDMDLTLFEETSFNLCGFTQFTAVTNFRAEGTVIDVRSRDRSIPDQPFRGLQVQIPSDQVFEILPGCFILLNHESTSGVSRIRIRAKGAR